MAKKHSGKDIFDLGIIMNDDDMAVHLKTVQDLVVRARPAGPTGFYRELYNGFSSQ
jgi:hypothetical protein